nr:MAG TPA: hypothetical protein [Caudoviricetes sp.]
MHFTISGKSCKVRLTRRMVWIILFTGVKSA